MYIDIRICAMFTRMFNKHFKEEKLIISLPHDAKYYKNQPVPENNVVVCITTQQALFNANWNDEEFWSQMIADIVQKLQE